MSKGIIICLISLVTLVSWVQAEPSETPFLPTWKLLNSQQKEQFVSGYIQGWIDAGKVTDIAIGFIKENPEHAIDSLEGIKKVYDLSLVRSEALVREIDNFYSKTENKSAGLSLAITAAKSAIRPDSRTTVQDGQPANLPVIK